MWHLFRETSRASSFLVWNFKRVSLWFPSSFSRKKISKARSICYIVYSVADFCCSIYSCSVSRISPLWILRIPIIYCEIFQTWAIEINYRNFLNFDSHKNYKRRRFAAYFLQPLQIHILYDRSNYKVSTWMIAQISYRVCSPSWHVPCHSRIIFHSICVCRR